MTNKKRPRGLAAAKTETMHDKHSAAESFVQSCDRKTRERPILFSAPMVQAILAGQKTETRRVVRAQPHLQDGLWHVGYPWGEGGHGIYTSEGEMREEFDALVLAHCPYGAAGDRLWVRETWSEPEPGVVLYRAEMSACAQNEERSLRNAGHKSDVPWRPSIFMPRAASRLMLEVAEVQVERLQDISEQDARAEGIDPSRPVEAFRDLWDSINGQRVGCAWDDNPLVYVVRFSLVQSAERTPCAAGGVL